MNKLIHFFLTGQQQGSEKEVKGCFGSPLEFARPLA